MAFVCNILAGFSMVSRRLDGVTGRTDLDLVHELMRPLE
jgi:hypothetical protein